MRHLTIRLEDKDYERMSRAIHEIEKREGIRPGQATFVRQILLNGLAAWERKWKIEK